MRKLSIYLFLILLLVGFTKSFAQDNLEFLEENQLRAFDGIQLNAGTFVPVINTAEVSTLNCDEGYEVKLIATSDLYLYDTTHLRRFSSTPFV